MARQHEGLAGMLLDHFLEILKARTTSLYTGGPVHDKADHEATGDKVGAVTEGGPNSVQTVHHDGSNHMHVTPEAAHALAEKVKRLQQRREGRDNHETDAAWTFLESCRLSATPDAVQQLVEAFLPALKIICERGYDPNGKTWREAGWRGLLHEIRKKNTRLHHRSWLRGLYDWDSAVDAINYLGFYIRLKNDGAPWGALGEPGSLADEPTSPVLMGDYHELSKEE